LPYLISLMKIKHFLGILLLLCFLIIHAHLWNHLWVKV
jgi:hypothetical protein